jgi:DNA-binding LacI/PurR family transcriptional regulator
MVSALLALPVPPTGIICTSDMQAMGALEAARDAGRAIPDELSIVGYDDLDIATYLGLTTIRQPLFESGMEGARILVSQLNGAPRRARRRRLKIELVRRTSTGPRPGGDPEPA